MAEISELADKDIAKILPGELDSGFADPGQPLQALEEKQEQARASIEGAMGRVDLQKKVLEAKEMAHQMASDRAKKAIAEVEKKAGQAKKGIEERQMELNKAEELVASLQKKLQSQAQELEPRKG
jgi:chromosome segregation ATPase